MKLFRVFCWLILLALPVVAAEKKAPAGDFQLPACPPDWKVEVVASAPKVINPSVISCAPDGRIFVGEDPMDMGNPVNEPSDRILCIHPDGHITVFATNLYAVYGLQYIDGKVYVHHSPKFSVFDDKNGVGTNRIDLIESDNPHPWTPTFNDHIPSNFRLGLDGYLYISTGDKGIFGAVGKDGRKLEIHGGGVYRMRPNGTELEVYSTGTRNHLDVALNSEDEIFTFDNTDDGQGWWTRVTHMVDGGFYGYPYDYNPQRPYTLWMMGDYGGGAPSGSIAYNEDALPEPYRGNLFLCDWAKASILRLKVERSGATYKIASREQHGKELDFLSKKPEDVYPSFFLPVGIAVIPDGTGFYVTDWFWAGWQNHSGENSITEGVGRILKVTYTGTMKPTPKPSWYIAAGSGKPFKSSTKDLVKGLAHPAQSVRLVAQRRLVDRKFDGYSRVVSLLKDPKAPPYARWSALWTLDGIDAGKKAHKDIVALLKDKDASVRMQVARQVGTRRNREAVPTLIAMLSETNPAIVFRAATALGRIGDPSATKPLIAALEEKDLFARYSVFKALNRIGQADGKVWPEIVKALASETPAIREGVGFALRETYNTNLTQSLSNIALDQSASAGVRSNALSFLTATYRKPPEWNGDWWNTGPASSSPPANTLDWESTPAIATTMRSATKDSDASVRRVAFEWVKASRDITSAPLLREMFVKEQNEDLKAGILTALGELKDAESSGLIHDLIKKTNNSSKLLSDAIEAAGKINTIELQSALIEVAGRNLPSPTLAKLLQSFGTTHLTNATPILGQCLTNSDASVRQAAEASLIQIGGDHAIHEFLTVLDNCSDIERRNAAARSLGNMKAKTAIHSLVDASTNPSTREAATSALAQMPDVQALDAYLGSLSSKNASLRQQCQQAIEAIRESALPLIEAKIGTNGISTDLVGLLQKTYSSHPNALKGPLFKVRGTQLAAKDYESFVLKNGGDIASGKKIFYDLNGVACSRCHRMNGEGGEVGPDLSDVGKKYGTTGVIDAVLHPSKQILDGYQVTTFNLKSGEEVSGAVRGENAADVTVLDSMGGKHVVQKSEISKRNTSKVSLMPEELHTALSLLEFADLIAYVAGNEPKAPTKPASSTNHTEAFLMHSNRGNALHKDGKLQEAKEEYLECLKIDPNSADAHYNLGNIWAELNNTVEAIVQFKEALLYDQTLAEAHNNLGALLHKSGDTAQAEKHFLEAIKLSPTLADAHRNFAGLLLSQGRLQETITQFKEAIRLKPERPEWHSMLGRLLAAQQPEPAISHFREAIRLLPTNSTAMSDLAWLLATHPKQSVRDGSEAIKLAERACELSRPPDAKSLDTLGAAYAEANRFDEALIKAQQAQTTALAAGKKELAATIERRMELYKNHKPFRVEAVDPLPSTASSETNRQAQLAVEGKTNHVIKLTPVKLSYETSTNILANRITNALPNSPRGEPPSIPPGPPSLPATTTKRFPRTNSSTPPLPPNFPGAGPLAPSENK
jgi:putative membrane-bound dehydrogenase-like protein